MALADPAETAFAADAARYIVPSALLEDGCTIRTRNSDLFQVLKIAPRVYDGKSDDDLRADRDRLNHMLVSLSDMLMATFASRVAFHVHTIRRRVALPDLPPAPDFAGEIETAFRAKLEQGPLFRNDHYLTILARPAMAGTNRFLGRFGKSGREDLAELEARTIESLNNCAAEVLRHLTGRRLGTIERNGRQFSEPVEFLARIVNGYDQPMPVPSGPLHDLLCTTWPLFGRELIRLDGPFFSRYAAALAIKEYPHPCPPWILNDLLDLPGELVISQSFAVLESPKATRKLEAQANRFQSGGGHSPAHQFGIARATGEVTGRQSVLGEHQFTLSLVADSEQELTELVADAWHVLSDTGCTPVRERKVKVSAWFSQLPGAFSFRPRPSPILSRNFASLAPLLDHYQGPKQRPFWGSHAALFLNAGGAPVPLSLHVDEVGHTLIVGQTGGGKTVLLSHLLAGFARFGATRVLIDKKRGAELFVRASGGSYSVLRVGEPSGFAPFMALDPAPDNLDLLTRLVTLLAYPSGGQSAADEDEIALAVRSVYEQPPHQRRFARVRDTLDPTRTDGPYRRLAKWCGDGRLAWLFDGTEDRVELHRGGMSGFDVTEFLQQDEVRGPTLFYLLSRVRQLMDGSKGVLAIDEFAAALGDKTLREFVDETLRTARSKNWLLIAATQSPTDITESEIAKVILGQCPTTILLPDPKATERVYGRDGFGLSEGEITDLRRLPPRHFLIRQGMESGVLRLDLEGLPELVALMSTRSDSVLELDRIRAEHGDDPAAWRPRLAAYLETTDA